MLPNRKQEYAEELRRQMDEQRKAKLRERKEYFSPAKPGNSAYNSPLIRAAEEVSNSGTVRRNLEDEFEQIQQERQPRRPALKSSPSRPAAPGPPSPRLQPQQYPVPPAGYYGGGGVPPQQPFMYPYMYPGYPPGIPPNYMQGTY
eukprot:sb/3473954/